MLPGDNYSTCLNVKLYLVESVTQASSHYKVIVSYEDAPFINWQLTLYAFFVLEVSFKQKL